MIKIEEVIWKKKKKFQWGELNFSEVVRHKIGQKCLFGYPMYYDIQFIIYTPTYYTKSIMKSNKNRK